MKAWIGIDVSKDWLDACYTSETVKPKSKQFKNDEAGYAKLLRWAKSLGGQDMHFCMESTGTYSEPLAHYLVEKDEKVSVENPARPRQFGLATGRLNKTDKADAKTIAAYTQAVTPALWRMSAPEVRTLSALVRRFHSLNQNLQAERNRLGDGNSHPLVVSSLQKSISFIQAQIKELQDQIKSHVDGHPGLKADKELLESIVGIGEITAFWILAELPDARQFESAQAAAAFVGLAPCKHESGKSIRKRTRMSKAGNTRLRSALYFPAITASRHNPIVRDLYNRLKDRGLPTMSALGACMRKLLMIAFGVLKTRTEFTLHPGGELAKAT